MRTDFPLIAFQEEAKVTDIDFFGGNLSLDIRGVGFKNVISVLINGIKSPNFVVVSPTQVLADQPSQVLGNPLTDIIVLKSRIEDTENSVISFEADLPPRPYSPANFVAQRFLKVLLTNKGTDLFNPNMGGDLLTLVGTSGTVVGQNSNLANAAAYCVDVAAEAVIALQATSSEPEEYKLAQVEVVSSVFDVATTSLDLKIRITSADGSTVVAGLSL